MTTFAWVTIGAAFVFLGTLIMWYVPYNEARIKELEKRESGKFLKRISFTTPMLCFGTSCFVIAGEDHVPLITDGKGNGKLFIPTPNGTGEGIMYTWIQDNEMKLSLTIYDKNKTIVSYISGNEWIVNKSETIDCNYDLENFEVVARQNSTTRPLLQIQLKHDRINLAFETYLKDDIGFFLGNNRMEFTGVNNKTINNDLHPMFIYPSDKNFGKRVQ